MRGVGTGGGFSAGSVGSAWPEGCLGHRHTASSFGAPGRASASSAPTLPWQLAHGCSFLGGHHARRCFTRFVDSGGSLCLCPRRSSLEPRATTRLQRPGPSLLRTQHRTTLRNGGVVRGTVVSSSPGEEVTILVPGSDKPRRISWAEVGDVQLGKHAPKSDSAPGSAGPGYGGSEPTPAGARPDAKGSFGCTSRAPSRSSCTSTSGRAR